MSTCRKRWRTAGRQIRHGHMQIVVFQICTQFPPCLGQTGGKYWYKFGLPPQLQPVLRDSCGPLAHPPSQLVCRPTRLPGSRPTGRWPAGRPGSRPTSWLACRPAQNAQVPIRNSSTARCNLGRCSSAPGVHPKYHAPHLVAKCMTCSNGHHCPACHAAPPSPLCQVFGY